MHRLDRIDHKHGGRLPLPQRRQDIASRCRRGEFDMRIAQAAPPSLRQRFVAITAKFREVLQLHARMIARVKNASEGMIRAIAAEVERAHAPMRTYGPRPGQTPQSSGAMVFNKVV